MDFFDQPENTSGALTSKLSALPTQLQELISANVLLIFIVFVNIVSSSALAIAYGWKLGLVIVFGGLPPIVMSGYLRIRLETRIEGINSERFADSAGLASEAVTAIRTVASLTLEKPILDQYSDMLDSIVRQSIKSLLWTMFWFALSQSLDFLVEALGFWYGGQLLASGEYTTEQFYVIFIGVLFAGQAAAQFFGYSTSITKAVGAANYILWLRTLKPIMQENNQNREKGPKGDSAIQVQDIDFNYKQREASRVLRGITMTVRCPMIRGETVANPRRSNQANQPEWWEAVVAANQHSSPCSNASMIPLQAASALTTKTLRRCHLAAIGATCPWYSRSQPCTKAQSVRTSAWDLTQTHQKTSSAKHVVRQTHSISCSRCPNPSTRHAGRGAFSSLEVSANVLRLQGL